MKKILVILAFLLVALIALSLYWQSQSKLNDGLVIIDINGNSSTFVVKSFRQTEVTSNKGKVYNVWSLVDLLEGNKISFEKASSLSLHSNDGGKIALTKDEIAISYLTFIEEDGKGYYRLIIPSDPFPQRWLKYISKITLE